jgi:hypothetical protein
MSGICGSGCARLFYTFGMKRLGPRNHLLDRARPSVCPACGGATTRPYLDCAKCRNARTRLPRPEREEARSRFAGLDGDELAARRAEKEELAG